MGRRMGRSMSAPWASTMIYHVTYSYLATGMEGKADIRDHGVVKANSAEEAKDIVARAAVPVDETYGGKYGGSTREFYRAFLTAKDVGL